MNTTDTFVIHQHHHYGWASGEFSAKGAEDAAKQSVRKDHGFLEENYQNKYVLEVLADDEGGISRYKVTWQSDAPKADHFGPPLYRGDYWFGDLIRVGHEDDCPKCGGTGVNHYYSWRQCWACGDAEKDGKSSGKAAQEKLS